MSASERDRHVVIGRVQGVGFRPFVYRLARDRSLAGFVLNAPEGVIIEVQGQRRELDAFARDLTGKLPPLAMIVEHSREEIPAVPGEGGFSILASTAGQGHHVLVSPDIATCPECLADMVDQANRRHRYPFTNCTNCGPRYTITRSLPYDRAVTSMACFPLCPDCLAEYQDPLNRRFHAQPNACPACGPTLWLADPKGKKLAVSAKTLDMAAKALKDGKILAMKGLGGFHLVADAANHEAVAELRRRKSRPSKPLAVMVPDIETLAELADVWPAEAGMLSGRERPIVLVRLKPGHRLAPDVSPDTDQLGAMLPYTPLHHVLLAAFREFGADPAALVMTSGNLSSEPIALGNREALARLKSIADLFLLHDRDILVRTDDSVVRFLRQGQAAGRDLPTSPDTAFIQDEAALPARLQFLRRARGFTPSPVFLPAKGPSVLGVGPELKNTVCLTKGDQAFLSQHIGDMQNLETAAFHKEAVAHLERILHVRPEAVVADKHPDYLSTRWALEESGLPVLRLQHHFAHVFAVLADTGLHEPVLGLALDGSGLGDDGTVWGGEFLYVDPVSLDMRRVGHFSPVRLPGGEAAIRQPWRMALSCLLALGRDPLAEGWPWLKGREQAAGLVAAMVEKGVNSPVTTSCGRLFDAVSALAGICLETSYEGQAAIRLEHVQALADAGEYACALVEGPGASLAPGREHGGTDESGGLAAPAVLDTMGLFGQAADDLLRGANPGVVSRRFHMGLSRGLADAAASLCARLGTRQVALSGGVFLNRTLSATLPGMLRAKGLIAREHAQEPPGDGCISLGQAYFGQLALKSAFPGS
jgi:hydrogenase maturation protein HypF